MIKKILEVKKLHEKKKDHQYWMSLLPEDRIREVENIRKEYHGEDYASKQRFPRVYRVIKLK